MPGWPRSPGSFTLADVARGVHDKLVHRHPHVFGDVEADTRGQVVTNWEAIKKEEKGRSSVTEGIPLAAARPDAGRQAGAKGALGRAWTAPVRPGTPASLLAQLLASVALRWTAAAADAPLDDADGGWTRLVGTLLLAMADMARRLGIDAEQALRRRAAVLRERIMATEALQAVDDRAAWPSPTGWEAPTSLVPRCPTRADAEGETS